ncbi:MAG: hypothetical protein HOK25_14695 [Rhodospirillaceae bacterium]|nr:hypothetical protein [Rhodospirillaceae bacterium]
MLLLMRKRVGTVVIKVFAFFLILGFGAWGVQDMLGYQVGGGGAVAEVGDVKLGPQEIYTDVYAEVNRMRRMFGNTFNIDQARQLGVIDGVVQRKVNAAATQQGAADLGIAIGDAQIRAAIVAEPMFKGLAGNFDRTRFQELLSSNGLTEAGYVASIRNDLASRQLTESVGSGAVAPARWVDAVMRYREETRSIDSVFVADKDQTAIPEPSDADARKYFKDNEKVYTAPEYRTVTFVRLDAKDLAKETDVAEDDMRKSYDDRADEFTKLEKRKIQQMLTDSEDKAKQAAAQLAEGKTFLAVAKAVAGQEEAQVELGEITKGDMLPDLAEAAFALPEGGISKPLKSALGWHLLKVTAISPGGTKPYDEVKAQVKDDLALEKALDAIFDLSNRLEDQLGGGGTVEEAAAALDLKVEKLSGIDQQGNDATGTAVAGLPAKRTFLATVFATEAGEDSAMTEAGEDGFFVLRIDKVTKPTLRPFEAVKAKVIDDWKAAQRADAAKTLATTIKSFADGGQKLAEGAATWSLTVEPHKALRRDGLGVSQDIGDALTADIFKLKLGKVAFQRVREGYRVAVLTRVTPADTSKTDKRKEIMATLAEALREDIASQLTAALRESVGVSVNQAAIEALFGERAQQQQQQY